MYLQFTPYIPPLLMAAAISAVLAFGAWRRRGTVPGAIPAAVLLLAVAEWSLAYALEMSSTYLPRKLFWVKAQYLGMVFVPGAWVAFVLEYTGRGSWLTGRRVALMAIEPLATLVLAWTSGSHALIYGDARLSSGNTGVLLEFTRGPWLAVDTAYSYVLALLGSLLLVQAYLGSPSYYRAQVGVLLLGASAPWLAETLSIAGVRPFTHVDVTPFAFMISGAVVVWGVLRYRLLDIVPVALKTVFGRLSDGIIVLDAQGCIVDLNPSAEAIVGNPACDALGQPVALLLPGCGDLAEGRDNHTETSSEVNLTNGEEERYYDLRITPLYDLPGRLTGRVVAFHDITERKRAEDTIKQMAYHDDLTGLPNRRLLNDRFSIELARARRSGQKLILMLLDLDRFKDVNDTLGHGVGDGMLRVVGSRLGSLLRGSDTAARVGGDEFVLLLPEMSLLEHADVVAQRILGAIRRPLAVDGHELCTTASLGIALYPEDGEDADTLIEKADLAMYWAKREGRDSYRWYSPAMHADGYERVMAPTIPARAWTGDNPSPAILGRVGQRPWGVPPEAPDSDTVRIGAPGAWAGLVPIGVPDIIAGEGT